MRHAGQSEAAATRLVRARDGGDGGSVPADLSILRGGGRCFSRRERSTPAGCGVLQRSKSLHPFALFNEDDIFVSRFHGDINHNSVMNGT
jgi:hypothetical protein